MLIFIIATVLIVALFGALAWWWPSNRLSQVERTAVYDIEEATDFVAANLPDEVDARLDRDTVTWLLGLHLAFLRRAGMATYGGVDEIAMEAATTGETVIAHEDEGVDYVIERVAESGEDIATVDIVVVLHQSNRYLEAIGALGPSVELG